MKEKSFWYRGLDICFVKNSGERCGGQNWRFSPYLSTGCYVSYYVAGLCGLLNDPLFRLTNPPPQNFHKNFDIDGLGNMVVHSRAVSLSDVGGECIGRQGKNWNGAGILPFQ